MALNLNGEKSRNRKYFNVSDYDTIIFEEILLLNPKLLSNIHKFIKLHPNKKLLLMVISLSYYLLLQMI